MSLPTDKEQRKNTPMARGLLDYFPDALAEVAHVSYVGNQQHNPGEPLHWAKEKSIDHADCIIRHLVDRGMKDTDGMRHSAKVAWRALALLQIELDNERQVARGLTDPVLTGMIDGEYASKKIGDTLDTAGVAIQRSGTFGCGCGSGACDAPLPKANYDGDWMPPTGDGNNYWHVEGDSVMFKHSTATAMVKSSFILEDIKEAVDACRWVRRKVPSEPAT